MTSGQNEQRSILEMDILFIGVQILIKPSQNKKDQEVTKKKLYLWYEADMRSSSRSSICTV